MYQTHARQRIRAHAVGCATNRRAIAAGSVRASTSTIQTMPIHYLRQLTGKTRTVRSNQQLGLALTFIAGATNAGGFLAVHQYTSHMTGIVSSMADRLALGEVALALAGLGALLSFISGSAISAILINWGRRRRMHSEYAAPLLVEAALLLLFGLLGARLAEHATLFAPWTVMLLCLIMGLQNAIITKISHAEIRTTHVTGLVTDLGIELASWPTGTVRRRPAVARRCWRTGPGCGCSARCSACFSSAAWSARLASRPLASSPPSCCRRCCCSWRSCRSSTT